MFQTPYPVCECFGLMVRRLYSQAWDIGCPTVKLETHLCHTSLAELTNRSANARSSAASCAPYPHDCPTPCEKVAGMEDRYAYERALLRYILTIRTREGQPVVWAETLLREFVEDLGAGLQCYEGDPAEIAAWAMGTGEGMGSEPQRLSCQIPPARSAIASF